MNERTIKYHVGRINIETGERQLMRYENFNGLLRNVSDMNSSDGLEDARDVNVVVARLNEVDDIFGGKFYYYRVDNDQSIRRHIRDDAPAEVLKWFQDEPEEEEEEATPVEEGETEGE